MEKNNINDLADRFERIMHKSLEGNLYALTERKGTDAYSLLAFTVDGTVMEKFGFKYYTEVPGTILMDLRARCFWAPDKGESVTFMTGKNGGWVVSCPSKWRQGLPDEVAKEFGELLERFEDYVKYRADSVPPYVEGIV